MIIYWKNHLGGFTGAHHYLATGFNRSIQHTSKTTAGAGVTLIAQNRSIMRNVQSRIFGRVN